MHSFLKPGLFTIGALAAPSRLGLQERTCGTSQTANYDDLQVVPAVPTLNTISSYQDLTYDGWVVNEFSVPGTGLELGLVPHSQPNFLVNGIEQGTQMPTISAGQGAQTFTLESFWFGCALNSVEGAQGATESCTIQVTSDKGSEFFTFPVDLGTLSKEMVLATPGDNFKDVQQITFSTSVSTGQRTTNVIGIDDLQYSVNC